MTTAITLRPAHPEDEAFLYQVYASTRLEELAPLGWTDDQVTSFLSMQFKAQHQYYHEQYPDANYLVILSGGNPVGRIYIDRRPCEIGLMDIALLPAHRGGGIGTALIQELLDEAAREDKSVTIYVEFFNRAQSLYRRLGFIEIENQGVYLLMRWLPPTRRLADACPADEPPAPG